MLLDWFTIAAQLINFLILLLLMRRFLYRPILNAMDEREQNITLRQREAKRRREEAEREAEEYRRLTSELESQRENILAESHTEAEEQRKEMIRNARQEVEHAQAAWYRAIEEEKEALLHELNQYASRQTILIARRALADLADAELEARIVDVFLKRLRATEDDVRRTMVSSLQSNDDNLIVTTAFQITEKQENQIRQTVEEGMGHNTEIDFEVDPSLVCGIEVKVPGHKISWSLSSYLDSLQEGLFKLIREDEDAVVI